MCCWMLHLFPQFALCCLVMDSYLEQFHPSQTSLCLHKKKEVSASWSNWCRLLKSSELHKEKQILLEILSLFLSEMVCWWMLDWVDILVFSVNYLASRFWNRTQISSIALRLHCVCARGTLWQQPNVRNWTLLLSEIMCWCMLAIFEFLVSSIIFSASAVESKHM